MLDALLKWVVEKPHSRWMKVQTNDVGTILTMAIFEQDGETYTRCLQIGMKELMGGRFELVERAASILMADIAAAISAGTNEGPQARGVANFIAPDYEPLGVDPWPSA